MAQYSVNWSAPVAPAAGTIAIGYALVADGNGAMVVATSANRATYGRAVGLSSTAGDSRNPITFIEAGIIGTAITNLGAGTASWVRVKADGTLERCTPSGSDDVVGWCETDGDLHSIFGILTAAITNGGGGGTVPTGTGFRHVTGGSEDAAAQKVTLSSAADVTGTLAVGNGGTGLTALGTNVGSFLGVNLSAAWNTWATTPSGANLASLLTSALSLTKVGAPTGTGLAKVSGGAWSAASATLVNADVSASAAIAVSKLAPSGTNGWVLTTVAGVPTWAASAGGGGSPGGSDTYVQFNDASAFGGVAGFAFDKTTGKIKLANTYGVYGRDVGNTTDMPLITTDASDQAIFGDVTSANFIAVKPNGGDYYCRVSGQATTFVGSGQLHEFQVGGVTNWSVESVYNKSTLPILGHSGNSSPYSVHGSVSVNMNNANKTLAASEFALQVIKVTSSTNFSANRTLTFPAVASDDLAYMKFVRNTQSGAFAVICSTGAGAAIQIAQGRGAWILVDSTGVIRMTADSVATP